MNLYLQPFSIPFIIWPIQCQVWAQYYRVGQLISYLFPPNLVNFKHFVLIQKSNQKVGFSNEGIPDMSL